VAAGGAFCQAIPESVEADTEAKVTAESEILALFDQWNAALQTGDAARVTELYADDAILLPTISNKVRHNHTEIRDYFEWFMPQGASGVIDEANVRVFGDLALNSGRYTFTFADGSSVAARFTYVYRRTANGWRIIEHHSSRMPE
jgi:uncharacterized protein (TIGR02246 family)